MFSGSQKGIINGGRKEEGRKKEGRRTREGRKAGRKEGRQEERKEGILRQTFFSCGHSLALDGRGEHAHTHNWQVAPRDNGLSMCCTRTRIFCAVAAGKRLVEKSV